MGGLPVLAMHRVDVNGFNSLPDHRPLGNINRARLFAYEASRANRNQQKPTDEVEALKIPATHKFLNQ